MATIKCKLCKSDIEVRSQGGERNARNSHILRECNRATDKDRKKAAGA